MSPEHTPLGADHVTAPLTLTWWPDVKAQVAEREVVVHGGPYLSVVAESARRSVAR